jgi:uncharacterized protein involved in exopolysaccharide biosynthesis
MSSEPETPLVPGPPVVRGYFVPVAEGALQEPISFGEMRGWLTRRWKTVAACGLLGFGLAVAAGLVLPRMYQAAVVITPVKDDGSSGALADIASRFGGLASLAGVNIGGSMGDTSAALAVLRSRSLLEDFIREKSLMQTLYASIWDEQTQQWAPASWQREPTLQDAVEFFDRKIRYVEEDRRSGIVTLAVRWSDPETAAAWANELVERANQRLRSEATEQSQRNIAYLRKQLADTEMVGIRESLFALLETEIRRGMLANGRLEFAFRVVDPARAPAPHQTDSAKPVVLAIAGAFLGLMLGIAIALLMGLSQRRR